MPLESDLKCLRVSQGMRTSLPLVPPIILSLPHCLEVCQAPNSNHSQPASLYPEGVVWAKSSSVLPQLITALHHHLCPSLSSLCLCSYPVSSPRSSAGSLLVVFMEPSGLRTMEQDDPAKNICDKTRHCQTMKERQEKSGKPLLSAF